MEYVSDRHAFGSDQQAFSRGEKMNKTLVLLLDVHNVNKFQGKHDILTYFWKRVAWYVFWTGQYSNTHSSSYILSSYLLGSTNQ